MEVVTDWRFSSGEMKRWNIFYKAGRISQQGELVGIVEADSADHACEFICHTRAISRIDIHAEPVKPGRPKERQGEYEHTAIDIRRDLLVELDKKRGNMSRREYVEQWLETL